MKIKLDKLTSICAAMGSLNPKVSEIEEELNSVGMSVYADSEKKTFKRIVDILDEVASNLDDDCKINWQEPDEEPVDSGCDGACSLRGECTGTVKHVRVSKHGEDWGDWWYCDCAIEQDLNHGFTVEML